MTRIIFLLLICAFALPASAGGPVSPDGLLDLWASQYVTVSRTANGSLRIVDCPDVFEARVGEAGPLTDTLREVSPYILAELRDEILALARTRPVNDNLAFRSIVAAKVFSPGLCERIQRASDGLRTLSSTDPGAGRCDGSKVGCDPPAVCGCETAQRDPVTGLPTGCSPPRDTCNTVVVPVGRSGSFGLELSTR